MNLIFVQFRSADWTGLAGLYGVAYALVAKDMSTFCRHDFLGVTQAHGALDSALGTFIAKSVFLIGFTLCLGQLGFFGCGHRHGLPLLLLMLLLLTTLTDTLQKSQAPEPYVPLLVL